MSKIIVVGAADPEREAIIRLANECEIPVHYAYHDGQEVSPGTAYKTDLILPSIPDSIKTILRVECDGPVFAKLDPSQIIVIDHHRPGDTGYGRPPEEFLAASSIGQVVRLLHLDVCRQCGNRLDWSNEIGPAMGLHDWPLRPEQYADIRMVAAADHCLAAAYRGECPGVNPDALMHWRVKVRASFQGRSVEEVLADVDSARKRLRDAARNTAYADLRGESIPELPEAAAREGIPFIASIKERNGREKVVLQSAPPSLIEKFLSGEIVPGLEDRYGDAARGFAGGYVPTTGGLWI